VFKGVTGPLSPDERYAAEVRAGSEPNTASLIVRDIQTGQERVIGEGHYPVWSRDGSWLAYTGPDGIYIIQNSPSAQARRLVTLKALHPEIGQKVYTADAANLYYPPIVSWSPDGKWLVYHHYNVDAAAPFPGPYSIVKVDVETGETTRLADQGLFPQWRWPVQEP
jgi:Tol biopolymer transport system component